MTLLAMVAAGVLAWSEPPPELQRVSPTGGQQGAEIVLHLTGKRLGTIQELMFATPGFEVRSIEAAGDGGTKATAHVMIAPDCRRGEHLFRARTQGGLSELRSFWVGAFPVVTEVEPNSRFEAPQVVPLGCTVEGTITSEDVDYFAIALREGQQLTAELEGIRLGGALFDAYLSVLDARRFDLVACDDSSLLLQDPVVSVIAPRTDTYVVEVRESSYAGNAASRYRLHLADVPRPTLVYPLGGPAGETMDVTFLGDPRGAFSQQVTLPDEPRPKFGVRAERDGRAAPSPNWMRVSSFPNALEVEPNNRLEEGTHVGEARALALNGVLEAPGDVDSFRFDAKKGQSFRVTVIARSMRSPLDSVLDLWQLAKKPKRLALNDDVDRNPDSAFDWTAPEDGTYAVRVRDHLARGGPTFAYRVELRAIDPFLLIQVPRFGRDSQTRRMIQVPRGNRVATLLSAQRVRFRGDLVWSFDGLPPGVTTHAEAIPAALTQVPVVFEATEDAAWAGAWVDIAATCDKLPELRSRYYHGVELVTGAPNRTVYYGTSVNRLAVAVVDEAPCRVELMPPKVPLVRNGVMSLDVRVARREGFDQAIPIRLLWKPPGIGAPSTVTLPKGADRVSYPISANGNAALATWKIVVQAEPKIGEGTVLVSSALTPLTVAEPYVGLTLERSAVTQGQEGAMLAKLETLKPFEGVATVQLVGLPAQVTSPPVEITPDDLEVTLPFTTAAKSPRGRHKGVFCQVVVREGGEPITHQLGQGSELRIDLPRKPKKADEDKAKATKPAAAPPVAKPMSRLEQLRADKRVGEQAEGTSNDDVQGANR